MDEAELVKFNDVSAEFINLSLYDTVLNLNQEQREEEGGVLNIKVQCPFFATTKVFFEPPANEKPYINFVLRQSRMENPN